MKKIKNLISLLSSIPVGIRLTIYFVLFGMLIGYLSFILITIGIAQNSMNMAYTTMVPLIKDLTGSRGDDFIAEMINKKNDEIARLYKAVLRSSMAEYGRVIPIIYYHDTQEGIWKKIYIGSNNIIRDAPVRPEVAPHLDKARKHKIYRSSPLFFGKSDRVSFMFNIPLVNARNRYILSLDMNREGIITFIVKDIGRFILFGIILLLISVLVGKLFARRIAAPIQRLSEVARERAAGNKNAEFTLTRRDEIGVLSDSLNTMTKKIDEHVHEIERRMATMETMNRIDKAVLSSISRSDLLHRVIKLVSTLFHGSSVAMALYNEEKTGFDILSRSQADAQGILAENPFIPADHIEGAAIERVKQVFQFTSSREDAEYRELFETLVGRKIISGVNVPVYMSETYLGSLVMARDDTGEFSREDMESIVMLADQVGIALQSVRAFEEKEQLLLGILLALTRSIDAKSKWTAGHSERVAAFSEKIAFRLDLPEETVRSITLSAILHDIGKIAVSEIILDKPERLSSEEYEIIKEHPATGARIISDIPSYGRIVPGILYHHEHWDGSGYPEGLSGDVIPLESRIITVADVWDAISADRPYRKGLGYQEAVDFMRRNSRALFDESIVEVFVSILREKQNDA